MSVGSELDGVAEQVVKNLLQAKGVADEHVGQGLIDAESLKAFTKWSKRFLKLTK
jgi:hypothetical protein